MKCFYGLVMISLCDNYDMIEVVLILLEDDVGEGG